MIKRFIRGIVERPWLRISLAALLLVVGFAPVGAPILSDNSLRQALGATPAAPASRAYTYRFDNQPDGTAAIDRSQVGGQSWAKVASLPQAVAQLDATGKGQPMVFARTDDSIWRSEDAGATWAKVKALPSKPMSMAVAKETPGLLLVGTAENGLFISDDRGQSWHPAGGSLSIAGPGTMAVRAVALNPTDEQIIYATAEVTMATPEGLHSTEDALMSPDGGRRWFQLQGMPAIGQSAGAHFQAISDHPLSVALTGTAGTSTLELRNATGLVSGLDDPDPTTRAATARVLGLAGNPSVVPALLKHLRDTDLTAGDQVATAIGRLDDQSAAPALIDALHDRDESVRARAATALGLMKNEAAVPVLAQMLKADGPLASERAAEALGTIASSAATAALVVPLADAQMTPARYAAMQGLEKAGRSAMPQLVAGLQSSSPATRGNSAEMLGWIHASDATPVLVQALRDQDPAVRSAAAWALGEVGTVPAQQALVQAMSVAQDGATRQAARQALNTAQAAHPERAALAESPAAALMNALTQIPASRWTLLFLVFALAAALLVVRPSQMPSSNGRGA